MKIPVKQMMCNEQLRVSSHCNIMRKKISSYDMCINQSKILKKKGRGEEDDYHSATWTEEHLSTITHSKQFT